MSEFKHPTPPPGYVDLEVIVLTREGIWLADGKEITHEPTRRLFARSLKHDSQGWFLHIGRETKRIEVEDTAFFVTRIDGSSSTGFTLSLSDGTEERLDPSTLSYSPGRLVCRVHAGRDDAKFLRVPYGEILRDLEESGSEFFLTIGGKRIRIARK